MRRTEHNEKKWEFPFVLYEPNDCGTEPLPLIIQLHGAGERGGGDELALAERHGFSHLMKNTEFNCRLVLPQCPKKTFWVAQIPYVLTFIERICAAFPSSCVSLTGLSMGGYGTWFTAMERPGIFKKIAPVCGGGMPWNAPSLTMPVWAFHGADDDVVFPYESENMVKALQKVGGDARLTIFGDTGHNSWEKAYSAELLHWLIDGE